MEKIALLFLFTTIAVISLLSCKRGIAVKTEGELIELEGFTPVEGRHCESTSIINALTYQNLPLSEAMVNGLASSPAFNLNKDIAFPFFGTRVLNFRENLVETTGLEVVVCEPEGVQAAYDDVKALLKQGIPVILRVDMRYLPYLWGGKYGNKYTSFGWHFVTLVKIDEAEGCAYVTETGNPGEYNLKKIGLRDLAKARNSAEGHFKAENLYYYFTEPAKHTIDYRKTLKLSLEKLCREYRTGTLEKLEKLPDDILNIESHISSKYMLPVLFFTFHGYIEDFGTGGSGFRNFYRDYLLETGNILDNEQIINKARYVDVSCKKWAELAAEFKNISETIKKYYNDEAGRKAMYSKAAAIAAELYQAEKKMLGELEALHFE